MKYQKIDGKIVIGLTEPIVIFSTSEGKKTISAKIDTGASKSSLDVNLASQLKLGPIIKSKLVKRTSKNLLKEEIKLE